MGKKIENSGDFADALHEMGHVMRDPNHEPATAREKLEAETNAWQWALESNNNEFDAQQWNRLHRSLHQYYDAVRDTGHVAHRLLVGAEERDPTIRPRVSSFGAPALSSPKEKDQAAAMKSLPKSDFAPAG
jgi:hypothetical protein